MSVEYQNSILWRGQDPTKQKFKPVYDNTKKVTRYFPGQKPDWGKDGQDDEDDDIAPTLSGKQGNFSDKKGPPPTPSVVKASRDARLAEARKKKKQEEERVVLSAGDAASSRLRRLQQTQSATSREERIARHRDIHEARVIEEATEKAKDEEDELKKEELKTESLGDLPGLAEVAFKDVDNEEEMMQFRREKARELALLKRQAENDMLKKEEEEDCEMAEDDLGEEESEEESDSEDNDPRRGALMKPVFVSRNQRETIKEKENVAREEEAAELKKEEKVKERKVETKQLVVDQIRRDDEAEQAGLNDNEASDMELIDDDDEKNEAEEYEKWKIRELRRIKRDKEERMAREQEIELVERRRRMTDQEREEDDAKLDSSSANRAEVKGFQFLQKYYHRGGFFQDRARTGEEPLYNRDYHEPTAEETFNKELLPKAMQVRRGLFGKKGQVKHTHLTEADTTDMSAAWAQHSKQVQRYQERMAGAKGINNFDKPTHMKKFGASGSSGP